MKIVLFVAIIIIVVLYTHSLYNTRTYRSDKLPLTFRVHRGFDDQKDAAALIENTIDGMIQFIRTIKKKFALEPKESLRRRALNNILVNFNPDRIEEVSPYNIHGDTSYVRAQGEDFVICVRQKQTGKLVPPSTIRFVILHELSHVATDPDMLGTDDVHGPMFWSVFKWLLTEANNCGFLTPIDYAKYPTMYCGININTNPLFIENVKSI